MGGERKTRHETCKPLPTFTAATAETQSNPAKPASQPASEPGPQKPQLLMNGNGFVGNEVLAIMPP